MIIIDPNRHVQSMNDEAVNTEYIKDSLADCLLQFHH